MSAQSDSLMAGSGLQRDAADIPLLLHRFERFAAATPDAGAVCCGTQTLSYSQLNQRANAVACRLLEEGIATGDVVALLLEPSIDLIAAVIGVMKSGAAYVPLDPSYPVDRLRVIVEQCAPGLLLTHSSMSDRLATRGLVELHIDTQIQAASASGSLDNPQVALHANDLCYVMYTSGSTGKPNGVMVSHGNIAGLIDNLSAEFAFATDDCWSAMHSFAFGFSVWEIWGALSTGACLLVVPGDGRGDPNKWSPLVLDQSVSVLSVTPSAFRQWLSSAAFPAPDRLQKLRLIVFSGEAMRAEDLRDWYTRVGGCSGQGLPQLVNTYALTETAGRVAVRFLAADSADDIENIGFPVADVEAFILDPATQQAAEAGQVGELYLAGQCIARGYLHDDSLTQARFVTLDPGDGVSRRFYRSGDLASLNTDGSINYQGRADYQIKLRGYRIDLHEIEQTLRRYPAVADAAVVLRTDSVTPQLAAWVVPEATARGDVEFWPSLGEYQIYDDLLYDFMSSDEVRVAAYQRAFERQVKGKVVLDIGTGKDAVLARLCAAAGARKVYAVEVLKDACDSARLLIEQLGQADRIEVIQGDMQTLELPEPVDVCTQGIVGNIGSSDGIVPIWNDAQQFFAESFTAVPARCQTLIAPAQLPEQARSKPAFGPLAAAYAERIFAEAGKPFDVRLCVRNFPLENLVAPPAVFETLDFHQQLSADYEDRTVFEIEQSAGFDGFLLWTRIYTDDLEQVDFLQHQQAWLPVWFPLADETVQLEAGDKLAVSWRCVTPAGQVFPDYHIDIEVQTAAAPLRLSYASKHFEDAYLQTALHRKLFAADLGAEHDGLLTELRDWLGTQLPAQMQPTLWELIARLPLNSNGKLDRQALAESRRSAHPSAAAETGQVYAKESYIDPLERDIAAIWAEVLERDSIGPDEDFFAAGGDSILAVRLTTEVQRYLDDTVFLAALFDAPTVAAYTTWLVANHPSAAARRSQLADDAAGSDVKFEMFPLAASVRDPSGLVELSWPQQSLWFLQRLYPQNTGANEQFLIYVAGGANVERLRQSWHVVLENHDILRTSFVDVGGTPMQRVASLADCLIVDPTPAEDLTALSPREAQLRLTRAAQQDIAIPFDLDVAPLLRTRLFSLPDGELVLLVTAHHIVADGMCVQLIRDALADAYANPAQPRPTLQYADFAAGQRQHHSDSAVAEDLNWWRQRLAGHDGQPVLDVGARLTDQAREIRVAFDIDSDLADRLRVIATGSGATAFMLLLAAWRVWLQRCFASHDLLIGSPMTMRRDKATARMLGCMVNNLVFRNPVAADASFLDVLQAEKNAALAAFDHSTVPFEKIVADLQPERIVGRHPLFQLMFMYEDRTSPPPQSDGLSFSADVLPVNRASYWDLELTVIDCDVGQSMPAFFGFREDLFDVAAVSGWADGFVAMLEAISVEPSAGVASLPLLSEAQQHTMLCQWNATDWPVAADQTLHSLFETQVARTPEAEAVRDATESLSYAALNARADHYAGVLQARGVQAGSRVGVSMARSADCVAVLLAVLKSGAAWLPLDPAYPASRIELMVADVLPDLVVSDGQVQLPQTTAAITVTELQAASASDDYAPDVPRTNSGGAAYVLFTSGSTGIPKGAVSLHAGAVSRCRWMWKEFGFDASDVFAQRTSLNFVDSVWEIFGPLMHGACLTVLPDQLATDPDGTVEWLNRQQVTHLVVVPSLLEALLDSMRNGQADFANNGPGNSSGNSSGNSLDNSLDNGMDNAGRDPVRVANPPGALLSVITSGEALSAALAQKFFATLPGCRLLNTYGTSETWDVSYYEVAESDLQADVIPVGKPVANARLYVLDDNRQPLPAGVAGELYIGGLALATGYINQPELTIERFVADPFLSSSDDIDSLAAGAVARMYRSGDLARYRADGNIVLLGRADRQIKLRGLRIEAGEVERLASVFPGVQRSVLVLRNDAQTEAWLTLYVVAAEDFLARQVEELRDHLRARLPRAMVPADICLLDALPLTPSGKLDINALPGTAALANDEGFVAPSNDTEIALAAIWAEALGVERVGIHDDFFALRGHSLLATRVIARIADSQGVEIPLQSLFETPTIAGLIRSIEALRWAQAATGDAAVDIGLGGESTDREVLRL